jgi:hypothetical protein
MTKIDWNKHVGNAPKDRRLLLIGKPSDSLGAPDIVVGHWHEAREAFVAVEIPSERQGVRPEIIVSCWAEIPDLPVGVELRVLGREDMKG